MLYNYKINKIPEIPKVIAVDGLDTLVKDGFLVLEVDSLNPDVASDIVEALGVHEFPFPVIVSDASVNIYEVIAKHNENAMETLEQTLRDFFVSKFCSDSDINEVLQKVKEKLNGQHG